MTGAGELAMFLAIGAAAVGLLFGPIGSAVARRLEGKAAADPAIQAEVEQLHASIGQLDAIQARLAELEERVDFAERLLAQNLEPDRLKR
jgi:hypothetical protein